MEKQILDWIAANPQHAPHFSMGGEWVITHNSGRETWGKSKSFQVCVIQAMTGTGPDMTDAKNRVEIDEKEPVADAVSLLFEKLDSDGCEQFETLCIANGLLFRCKCGLNVPITDMQCQCGQATG